MQVHPQLSAAVVAEHRRDLARHAARRQLLRGPGGRRHNGGALRGKLALRSRGPLANEAYRRLFGAQVVALVGTGLTTVALTLLAYDLADGDAGTVVGIALALKMVVYVFGAPLIAALAARLPRRRALVVYVRDHFGRDASDVAWALGASGLGAMAAALTLPRLLGRVSERRAMLAGGLLLPVGLALAALVDDFGALLLVWLALGVGLSLVQTPSGLLLRRSGSAQERPALFAAQFSLSHACWLATYPIAGVLGSTLGLAATAWLLAALAAVAVVVAARAWPGPGRMARLAVPVPVPRRSG